MPWDIHNNKGKKIGTLYEVYPGPLAILGMLLFIKAVGFSIHLFFGINSLLFPETNLSKDSKLNHEGLGSIKIGMHYKEAEKAARMKLVPVEGNTIKTQGCFYVKPQFSWYYNGMKFMLTDGHISRIDISNLYTETDRGIRVTHSPRDVESKYGKQPTVIDEQRKRKYITFIPPEAPNHRIVFDANYYLLDRYSVGRLPEIQYKNGCSKN
jgi:hypothetical protein